MLQHAKSRFPNLRIAYLSSRIYGGYATTPLNPEPYAYESAFAARWLIQKQIAGDRELQFDDRGGAAKAPLLLWGPYLWADGVKGRKSDKLVYRRDDLAQDGTHPSQAGREKVAQLMLEFFKTHELLDLGLPSALTESHHPSSRRSCCSPTLPESPACPQQVGCLRLQSGFAKACCPIAIH